MQTTFFLSQTWLPKFQVPRIHSAQRSTSSGVLKATQPVLLRGKAAA